ncbi:MAG: GlxA family transcriptional regulator [Burkholderiaceae bacterium]
MQRISVALVVFPNFQMLDVAGPADAFGEVKVLSKGAFEYQLTVIGNARGPMRSSSGITVMPERTIFDPCPHFDTIILAGGLGVFDVLDDTPLCDWLVRQSRQCRRVAAICNGVFALGAAGLLKGKTVTTHWMDASRLAQQFPRTRVEADRIFLKDGNLYTTAGVTAGIDLSLVLIEEDIDRRMALDVAKYLIVYLRRAGGQSQFSPLLETQSTSDFGAGGARQYLLDNLSKNHSLESLAEHLGISARQLSRTFSGHHGLGPMAFLEDARIDTARRLLETTDITYRQIAEKCGLGDSEKLRRVFVRKLGVSPSEYRKRFRSGRDECSSVNS